MFSHVSFLLRQKNFKNTSLMVWYEKQIMCYTEHRARGGKWHSSAGAAVVLSERFCSSLTLSAGTALPLNLGLLQVEVCVSAWAAEQGSGRGVTVLDLVRKKVEVVVVGSVWLPGRCLSCRCEFIHYLVCGHKTWIQGIEKDCAVFFLISSFFSVVLTHDVLKKARGNLEVSKIFVCI